MKTHRCDGSLDAGLSIRFEGTWMGINEPTKYQWWLMQIICDWDYGGYYMRHIAVIEHCPFCGKKLD